MVCAEKSMVFVSVNSNNAEFIPTEEDFARYELLKKREYMLIGKMQGLLKNWMMLLILEVVALALLVLRE